MQTDATPIQEALHRQAEAGPRVLRLTGPGAWAAASRWVEQHGAEREVTFPFLPEDAEGTLWLHEAPGSRYQADILAAHCLLRERSWTLLLTGRAVDGAHPSQGETLRVDLAMPPGEGQPTRVLLPVVDGLEEAIAVRADLGDVAMAHALYEQLGAEKPAARRWCWVELLRLLHVCRAGEVEEVATSLPGRAACADQVLLAMIEASLNLGSDRTRYYLDALIAQSPDPGPQRDALFFRALLDRDVDSLRKATPRSTRHAIVQRRVLRNLGEEVAGPVAVGGFAVAMEAMDSSSVTGFLQVGDLYHAVKLVRKEGRQVGSAYLQDGGVDEAIQAARRALESGNVEAADASLTEVEDRLPRQKTRQVFYWLLYASRVAAQRGNVGWLHALEARLHTFDDSTWASVELIRCLVPQSDPPADLWCRVALLRLLESCSRQPVEALEQGFAALPARPVVLGPYVLHQVIASGGIGRVWRGEHRLTGRAVAVKVLARGTPDAVRLFRAEIDIVTRFDHPMIVSVLDLLEVDSRAEEQSRGALQHGQPALVMELVENGTLADHVGSLGWEDIRDAMVGVLEALAYAHAHGVVHQDLKPRNILVGEGNALRLADFGLAALDEDRVAGTPTYMAPEQFRQGRVGPTADVYAAGCIAWTLACGLPPFVGGPEQLASAHTSAPLPDFEPMLAVPPQFEGWLRRCLEKTPRVRFPSAAAAAEALLGIADAAVDLPGHAPLPSPVRSSTTFVLHTLLDLPDHGFEDRLEATATRRLHDIFEERASWRPRIPTHRLLHKGEPPVLFQRDAQRELWTTLMSALAGRVQRVELHGRGGEPLLRWLRRRARLAGLWVHEAPVAGHVSIVDATDLETLPDATRERWVLVFLDRTVPGGRRIALRPFVAGAIWWIVTSRILLHPQTGCRVATEAAGSPDVAFALVDDWIENPGMEMTSRGLRLLREPEDPGPQARAQWCRFIERSRPERLRLAQLLAIKPFASSESFLRRAAGTDELHLGSMAIACNGTWRLPVALRSAVLATLDEQGTRALHRLSAEHEEQPSARALHACLADPTLQTTESMLQILLDVHLPRRLLELVQIPINCHLLEARETRARWRVSQLTDPALVRHLMDPDPLLADVARLEHFERRRSWPAPVLEAVGRTLTNERRPSLAIRLAHALAQHLVRAGHVEEALARIDELGAHLEGHPQHLPHLLVWARARCFSGPTAIEAYRQALVGAPIAIAPSLHIDLADELLVLGHHVEALHHLDASRGVWSLAADYNRAVALIALERDDEARQLTFRLTALSMGSEKNAFYIGLCYADLFLHLDEPTPMWEALLALVVPLREPLMKELLQRRLRNAPRSPRADRLVRELGTRG